MLGHWRILVLFTLSAMMHAVVIAAWVAPPALPVPAGSEALRVTLLAPVRLPPRMHTLSRPRTVPAEQPTPDPIDVAAATTEHDAGPDQAAVEIRGRLLESALYTALRPHFYYPPLARQQGWQGEVRLALRVEANGTLTQVRIVRGSGHGILDNAALRSLGRVQHLPEAVALLNGRNHDVILPVQYQLTGIF